MNKTSLFQRVPVYKALIVLVIGLAALLLSGCGGIGGVTIEVEQPPSGGVDMQIPIRIDMDTSILFGSGASITPQLGVCLPVGWQVIEPVPYSGDLNGQFVYDPATVTALLAKYAQNCNGYVWGGEGTPFSPVNGTVYEAVADFKIMTGKNPGKYDLFYAVGIYNSGIGFNFQQPVIKPFDLLSLYLEKTSSSAIVTPGQVFTYTITARSAYSSTFLTNGVITDQLPEGLSFVGPVMLDPPSAGVPGSQPPTLASGLNFEGGNLITMTFPVRVDLSVIGGKIITNTATIKFDQIYTPALATNKIFIDRCAAKVNGAIEIYDNVQDAVDAAPSGGKVLIAGYCRGVQNIAGLLQTAYITRTVTIQGGYNPDFSIYDPALYPTTLDAMDAGRVFYIDPPTGLITVSLDSLSAIQGNKPGDYNTSRGGGLYASGANLSINQVNLLDNSALFGLGAYVENSDWLVVKDSRFNKNYSKTVGAGTLYSVNVMSTTLTGSQFNENRIPFGYAGALGAGIGTFGGKVSIINSEFNRNEGGSNGPGGALTITGAVRVEIRDSHVIDNSFGNDSIVGGADIEMVSNLVISGSEFISNSVGSDNLGVGNAVTGGGLLIKSVISGTISSSDFISNSVGSGGLGGGIYILNSKLTLTGNTISKNSGNGGGLYAIDNSAEVYQLVLDGNTISDNRSLDTTNVASGGGLYLSGFNSITLSHSLITGNQAAYRGAGMSLYGGDVDLLDNQITNNILTNPNTSLANSGAGIYLNTVSNVDLKNTIIYANRCLSGCPGGGMAVDGLSTASLYNDLIAGNQGGAGAGIYVTGSSEAYIYITTIADNTGASAIRLGNATGAAGWGNLLLAKSIVSGHALGIDANQVFSTPSADYTLWNNTIDHQGTVNHYNDVTGDPGFVDPADGDYHLAYNSDAIDKAPAWYGYTDFEGDPRPYVEGLPWDLGFDEFTRFANLHISKTAIPESVEQGQPVSFVLSFDNRSSVAINQSHITDVLPVELFNPAISSNIPITLTGGANYTWQLPPLEPGEGGLITITAGLVQDLPGNTKIVNTASISTTQEVIRYPADDQASAAVLLINDIPAFSLGADVKMNEGSSYAFSGSFTDQNNDPWTASIDYGDRSGSLPLALQADKSFSINHVYKDNGVYTLVVTINDGVGGIAQDSVVVTVDNVAPVLPDLANRQAPALLSYLLYMNFTDPGALDTHTVMITWEEGVTQTLNLAAGVTSFAATHTYNKIDIYRVIVTVTDKDGAADTEEFFLVITPLKLYLPAIQNR